MQSESGPTSEADVDKALAGWRQGDCVLGEHWFVHRIAPPIALTAAAQTAIAAGSDLAESAEVGLVVVTQTCDLVRGCRERPFVEVAPLVEVDDEILHSVKRRRRRTYAAVPALLSKRLVADLDRTMTVEKSLVAGWHRVPGCRNDEETREFASVLANKRERFAFPDDFNRLVGKLRARLVEKHDRQTEDGRALRRLREIRVQAAPAWNADSVELFLWFIRDEREPIAAPIRWQEFLAKWMAMVRPEGRFTSINGQVVGLEDMTARDYVESDPLDLDYLSTPAPVDAE